MVTAPPHTSAPLVRRLVVPLLLGIAVLLGSAGTAQAAPVPALGIHCGTVTCSTYLSRAETAAVAGGVGRYQNASNAAIGGAFAVTCTSTGVGAVAAAGCGAIGAVYGGYAVDQFVEAAKTASCVRMVYPKAPDIRGVSPLVPYNPQNIPSLGWSIRVDRSGYCQ
jgi:hypothetical protein